MRVGGDIPKGDTMDKKSIFATDGVYARIMNFIWKLLMISILWVVCCIPVVTAGASCAAAYYAAAKVIRGGEGKVISEFFHAFRTNFRQSAVFSVIYAIVLAVLLLECYYLYFNSEVSLPVLYLFYGMVLVLVSNIQYLFSFMSRFTLTKFELFRMATLCSFRHLITTILLLMLFAAMCIAVYLMPWGILVFPGVMFLIKTYPMERVMRKYMPTPEDGDTETQKWYYNI